MADRSTDQYKMWSEHRLLAGVLTILESWFGDRPEIDESTQAITTIEYSHHEIHEGNHYKVGYQDTTMDTDDIIMMLLETPDSEVQIHFTLTAQSTGAATVQIFENPTINNVGTPVTPSNRNRNSTNVSALTVYHTPTVGANGTKWAEKWIGGEGFKETVGGETRGASEIILKRNEQYLIIFTAEADGIKGAIGGDWYELTPAN